jgi:hypothetical protein
MGYLMEVYHLLVLGEKSSQPNTDTWNEWKESHGLFLISTLACV